MRPYLLVPSLHLPLKLPNHEHRMFQQTQITHLVRYPEPTQNAVDDLSFDQEERELHVHVDDVVVLEDGDSVEQVLNTFQQELFWLFLVLDNRVQNINVLVDTASQPDNLFAILIHSLGLIKVAEDELLDDGFDFIDDFLNVLVVHFIAIEHLSGVDLVVVGEVQVGGDEFDLVADGVDFAGELLLVVHIADGEQALFGQLVALLD